MSDSLRSKVIRLAHANPSLRPHLLPLLAGSGRVAAGEQDNYYQDFNYRTYLDMLKYFNTLTREDDAETGRVLGSWSLDPQYVLRFRTAKGWGPLMDAVLEPIYDTDVTRPLENIMRATPEGKAFGRKHSFQEILLRWFHANVGGMKSFARDQVGD